MDNSLVPFDRSIFSKLSTYDDFLSVITQIDSAYSSFSWLKADLLAEFVKKFGEKSLTALSKDIHQPSSTLTNYSRVAIGFPPEKRIESASFSAHLQSCYADSYDSKTQKFVGNERFKWIEQAADSGLSTRQLAEKIQEEKAPEASKGERQQSLEKIRAIGHYLQELYSREEYKEVDAIYKIVLGIK